MSINYSKIHKFSIYLDHKSGCEQSRVTYHGCVGSVVAQRYTSDSLEEPRLGYSHTPRIARLGFCRRSLGPLPHNSTN